MLSPTLAYPVSGIGILPFSLKSVMATTTAFAFSLAACVIACFVASDYVIVISFFASSFLLAYFRLILLKPCYVICLV